MGRLEHRRPAFATDSATLTLTHAPTTPSAKACSVRRGNCFHLPLQEQAGRLVHLPLRTLFSGLSSLDFPQWLWLRW